MWGGLFLFFRLFLNLSLYAGSILIWNIYGKKIKCTKNERKERKSNSTHACLCSDWYTARSHHVTIDMPSLKPGDQDVCRMFIDVVVMKFKTWVLHTHLTQQHGSIQFIWTLCYQIMVFNNAQENNFLNIVNIVM